MLEIFGATRNGLNTCASFILPIKKSEAWGERTKDLVVDIVITHTGTIIYYYIYSNIYSESKRHAIGKYIISNQHTPPDDPSEELQSKPAHPRSPDDRTDRTVSCFSESP